MNAVKLHIRFKFLKSPDIYRIDIREIYQRHEKNSFAEVSKNLAGYRFENNFVMHYSK